MKIMRTVLQIAFCWSLLYSCTAFSQSLTQANSQTLSASAATTSTTVDPLPSMAQVQTRIRTQSSNLNFIFEPPDIKTYGDTIAYTGILNAIGAKSALALLETKKYKTFVIRSDGGEVISAIELGNAIHRLGLDVVVRKACYSSCANYIFTAGNHKTIEEDSFVMWHGDARQRNFVDGMEALAAREASQGADQLTPQERGVLAYRRKTIQAQDLFYSQVKINGRIGRIGHELAEPVQQWVLSVREMAAFGLTQVSAPADYGTPAYCDARRERDLFLAKVSCLQVPPEDVAGTARHAIDPNFFVR